jgi:hypothetical protein
MKCKICGTPLLYETKAMLCSACALISAEESAESNIDRLLNLASSLSEYLAHTNVERFEDPEGAPRKIEEQFYRVTNFLSKQLIPKENNDQSS